MGLFTSDKTSKQSGHINVVAEIKAKAGYEAEVRTLLEALTLASREEPGCEGYHLHVDKKNPVSFFTYEEWTSEDALKVHLDGAKPKFERMQTLLDGDLKLVVLEHLV